MQEGYAYGLSFYFDASYLKDMLQLCRAISRGKDF